MVGQSGEARMTEQALVESIESATDRVEMLAARYLAAYPTEDVHAYRAHLEVVSTGSRLSQNVSRYLAGRFGINTARYSLLRALYFADEQRLPQVELARTMSVTSPNVTQLIDALEKEGLVERETSEADRRVTFARLTQQGVARSEELVPAMADFMRESCAALSDEEQQQLVALLSRVRQALMNEG